MAQKLVERGHEVHWSTGAKFRSKVEATGAIFEPFRAAYDYDDSDFDAAFHGRGALSGVNQMKFDLVHVFVKQLAPQHRDLEAILAEFPAGVILADFSTAAAASPGTNPLPSNARAEAFIPFKHVMPHVDVYVTNGGFGGIQYALVNGVPVVTGGTTEDKPETNARIAYSGAGINLKTANPTPDQVRDAVRKALGDPQYRLAAQKLKAEFSKHDAPAEAAVLLERLAETRQPVVDPLCMEERVREDGVQTLAWSPC